MVYCISICFNAFLAFKKPSLWHILSEKNNRPFGISLDYWWYISAWNAVGNQGSTQCYSNTVNIFPFSDKRQIHQTRSTLNRTGPQKLLKQRSNSKSDVLLRSPSVRLATAMKSRSRNVNTTRTRRGTFDRQILIKSANVDHPIKLI